MNTIVLLRELTCYSCIVHFAMDGALYDRRLADGDTFYCPNGHAQHFTESTVDQLKKQNQNLKTRLSYSEQACSRQYEENQRIKKEKAVIKGQLTKTRKRVANGTCPCCHRTFINIARHMDSKHPDFKKVVG